MSRPGPTFLALVTLVANSLATRAAVAPAQGCGGQQRVGVLPFIDISCVSVLPPSSHLGFWLAGLCFRFPALCSFVFLGLALFCAFRLCSDILTSFGVTGNQ